MSEARKYCFVPGCANTSTNSPGKLFLTVPKNEGERLKWLKASRRDLDKSPISPKAYISCCEDHFDMEQDVENWSRYLFYKEAGLTAQLRLKKGVVPHKFDCQKGRNLTSGTARKSVVHKLGRRKMMDELFAASTPDSSAGISSEQIVEEDLLEENINEQPVEEVPEVVIEKCDKIIQVVIRPHYRSKFVQTNLPQEEIPSDMTDQFTQMSPAKRIRISCSPSDLTADISDESTVLSADGSEWVQTTSSSLEEALRDEALRKQAVHINMMYVRGWPMLYTGITKRSFYVINFLCTQTESCQRDIFLTLKKIRMNDPFTSLGNDFSLTGSQAGKIFNKTVPKLAKQLKQIIYWPDDEIILRRMPIPFRLRYCKVRAIIDCFEVPIEKPSDPWKQSLTWSNYKAKNTFKYLVSSTPHGFISFVSGGYGGRTSDTKLVEHCGFINELTPGSHLMADRGFKNLVVSLTQAGVTLVRPPSVSSGERLSKEEARKAKRIASLRIHIERVIGRMRTFSFLAPGVFLDHKLIHHLDDVVIIVAGLVNVQDPLIL